MCFINKFKKWYRGEFSIQKKTPESTFVRISGGYFKKTPTAALLNSLVNFWLKHWKVLLPTLVAAFVALFIHFDSKNKIPQNNVSKQSLNINIQQIKKALTSKSRSFANHSLGLPKRGAVLLFLKAPYLSRYV